MKKIKKNKKKIVTVLIVLFVLLVIYSIFLMMPNGAKSLYGDRLDGINDVKISQDDLNKVVKKIEKESGIVKAKSNIKGRLINFEISLENDVATSITDTIEPIILKEFSKEEKEFYDFQIFIDGDLEEYPIIGYKHKTADKFVWTNNK